MAKETERSTPVEGGKSEVPGPSLEELRALWDIPTTVIAVVDKEHRIRSANLTTAKSSTRDPASLPGLTLKELTPFMAAALGPIIDKVIAAGAPAIGLRAPFDWGERSLDVFPVGAGSQDPRALLMFSDPQRRLIDGADGIAGGWRMFFVFARRLARATSEESAGLIEEVLRFIAQTCELERAYVRLLSDDEAHYFTQYEYHRPDLSPLTPREVTVESIAWANDKFLRGEVLVLSSPDDLPLPPDDKGFRAALERVGVRATISVPVLDGPRLLGYVACPASEGRVWTPADVHLLGHIGEMIAAVVARNHAEEDFRDRLHFEEQLAAATARFVDIAPEDVDAEILRTLAVIGTSLKLDRSLVAQLDDDDTELALTHEWCAPGVPSMSTIFSSRPVEELVPLVRRVLAGEVIAGREEDAESGSDMEVLLRRMQVHAFVLTPLYIEGRVKGMVTLQTLRHHRFDPPAYVARVKLIVEVIAAALSYRASRERLRRWERRFAQILDCAMDGVALVDVGGTVKYWTAQATSVFGKGRDEMLGRALADVIYPDDRATLSAKIATAVSTASPAQRFELRGLHDGGRVVPIELSMTRLERSEGILIALFVRDITDRKRIEAEKQRAFDEVARQKRSLERERDYLREEHRAGAIIGESRAMRRAIELVDAVAETESSVLLLGESGVGKEVFASAVHARSARVRGPFVKVNCASVPGSLFESEFFGHAKGSFTGAVKDRIGRFELADGGTLFLDEIGEIPIELQSKLLRVLQEGEIERVGEDRTRKLDVRIVAATNRDLEQEIESGRFRRDLYFRLSVFPIAIPKLCDRESDVLLLARHFLECHATRVKRDGLSLSPDDEARLLAYDWPGNVRELDHVIERAVILSRTPPLRLDLALPDRGGVRPSSLPEILRDDDMRRIERENLALALKKAGGRISGPGGAAELLGMHPSTLRDRMKAFGLMKG